MSSKSPRSSSTSHTEDDGSPPRRRQKREHEHFVNSASEDSSPESEGEEPVCMSLSEAERKGYEASDRMFANKVALFLESCCELSRKNRETRTRVKEAFYARHPEDLEKIVTGPLFTTIQSLLKRLVEGVDTTKDEKTVCGLKVREGVTVKPLPARKACAPKLKESAIAKLPTRPSEHRSSRGSPQPRVVVVDDDLASTTSYCFLLPAVECESVSFRIRRNNGAAVLVVAGSYQIDESTFVEMLPDGKKRPRIREHLPESDQGFSLEIPLNPEIAIPSVINPHKTAFGVCIVFEVIRTEIPDDIVTTGPWGKRHLSGGTSVKAKEPLSHSQSAAVTIGKRTREESGTTSALSSTPSPKSSPESPTSTMFPSPGPSISTSASPVASSASASLTGFPMFDQNMMRALALQLYALQSSAGKALPQLANAASPSNTSLEESQTLRALSAENQSNLSAAVSAATSTGSATSSTATGTAPPSTSATALDLSQRLPPQLSMFGSSKGESKAAQVRVQLDLDTICSACNELLGEQEFKRCSQARCKRRYHKACSDSAGFKKSGKFVCKLCTTCAVCKNTTIPTGQRAVRVTVCKATSGGVLKCPFAEIHVAPTNCAASIGNKCPQCHEDLP